MIAGLEEITAGKLYLGDTLSNQIPVGERDIAMVFQNYALYPHMTVAENITFGLKANKVAKKEIETRLEEVLEMLSLKPFRDRLPRDLSGGQRQRIALARAVVKRSDFFLLDEPLSNLDVRLRLDARKELVKIHEKYQQTFIYVTHDQIEAMTITDRIVILNEGQIQMFDSPLNVYQQPQNIFTVSFIGSSGMNILNAIYEKGQLTIAGQIFRLGEEWADYLNELGAAQLFTGIRPENLLPSSHSGELKGIVKYLELLGKNYALTIHLGKEEIVAFSEEGCWRTGDEIYLDFEPENLHFFSADDQKNLGYPAKIQAKKGRSHEIFTSV